MRHLLIFTALLLLIGCDSDTLTQTKELNKNNPHLIKKNQIVQKSLQIPKESQKERILKIDYKNKIALEELKNRQQEQLATINAHKEEQLKKLEVEKAKTLQTEKTKQTAIEANKSIQLAQISQKTALAEKEKEISLYKIVSFLLLLLLILWLILRYINQHAKRKHEAYLKEQAYNFEAFKHEAEMKHKNIHKMLEIISDDKSDPSIKKEITKILSHNKSSLIEHKKR